MSAQPQLPDRSQGEEDDSSQAAMESYQIYEDCFILINYHPYLARWRIGPIFRSLVPVGVGRGRGLAGHSGEGGGRERFEDWKMEINLKQLDRRTNRGSFEDLANVTNVLN